ncbi:MAG: hypothetical protein ABI231_08735 [Candidatus Tumulicola sp.]
MKSVSRDTALLLFTLQMPGALPRYAARALGEGCDSVIAQMILDGILEIEAGGRMLSGPAAHALVCGDPSARLPQNSLAALSARAIEYAATIAIAGHAALSQRLYAYNRVPASQRWRSLLPDEGAVDLHLGIRNDAAARMLDREWIRLPPAAGEGGWIAWQSRRVTQNRAAATYKLYVSPACTELRATFAAVVQTGSRSAAFDWKMGNDAYGLLRPDKFVLYFREFSDLQATAAQILENLQHCPAQGVPFTAELVPGGLLSWGIDPPAEEYTVAWLARESWRSRICDRLATALLLAKTSTGTGISPSRFAIERLRLEGIDTDTWAPTRELAWAAPQRG